MKTLSVVIARSNPIYPDPRVEKAARALNEAGYSVGMVGWDRSGKLPEDEFINGIRCHRISIRARYGAGMRNMVRLLQWQYGLFVWLRRNRAEFDCIHACDFDTIMPAWLIGRLYRKKIAYDIFDFFSDHFRTRSSLLRRVVRSIDLWFIRHVDGVILADDSRVEQIEGVKPRLLAIINNTPPDLTGGAVERIAREDKREMTMVFIGILQKDRGIEDILKLLRRHSGWRLELAGFGAEAEMIANQAVSLPNVSWHGRISYEKALELSAEADVMFAIYDPSVPNHRYSSPNKVFEAMMLSIPIIVAGNTGMDRLVEKHGCGIVVQYGNLAEIENAIIRLRDNLALRENLGANGRKAYESTYNWETMRERLVGFYDKLFHTGGTQTLPVR